ncbi:MAG: CHAT domain-containing protein, partial [Anaerolineae bacterium]|nr:CHAT domain-containing protein [Anaerolineae bacterium]
MQPALAEHPHWVVVPHGPLHYLPFHALYDKQSATYLTEQRQISYTPSASVLKYCQQKPLPLKGGGQWANPIGGVGLSSIATFGHSYQGRLPLAVTEAEHVAQIMGNGAGGAAYVEEAANLPNLKAAAEHCTVLHLATHGDFRADNPLFSGLAFADGMLTTLDVFGLRLRASLVTLSACQTGRNVL